ncbi:hypothetical protein ACIGCP_07190 [Cellulophaga baltica]|uniref:hypothetical protein n=1 Tax=Cellulophaga baltica TaxID=76594 RepID=UPI0037C96603
MGKTVLERIDIDNLISNLRGELGTVIESWTLLREYSILTNQLTTDMSFSQYLENFNNSEFNKRNIIKKKFVDDIISKLSELAQQSNRHLNFFLATQKIDKLNLATQKKIDKLNSELKEYQDFIVDNNFKVRRNEFISHKKLPLTWAGHKAAYSIPYKTITKAIAKALILMKKIDDIYIGANASLNWRKLRANRYSYDIAARAQYMKMYYVK